MALKRAKENVSTVRGEGPNSQLFVIRGKRMSKLQEHVEKKF